MKRILPILLSLALFLAPMASWAEEIQQENTAQPARDARSLFDNLLGGDAHPPAPTATPAPEVSPEPTPDAAFLFGDLFKGHTQPPESTPTPAPENEVLPSGSLFGENVSRMTGDFWGGKVDFAYVNGWLVSRGYFDGKYCLTGISPLDGSRVVLADSDPVTFVSTGDAIVYFGEGTKGDYGWLLLTPGESRPLKLPLDGSDEVFYADDDHLWYYSFGKGESATIGRMEHDGSKKKKLGTVKGNVVTMMPGGEVLLVHFANNRVQLWKDGKYETLYSPEQEILSVFTAGREIWIEHEDGYGPLVDGEVRFRLPGRIAGTAGSTDQFALLVQPYEDAAFFDVYLFNEVYRAYAGVGRVKRSDSTNIEFQQNQMIVWGSEESLIFEYPIPGLWLPYGYYDFASAENLLSDLGWTQLLIGSWCAEPTVGAGYAERLIFTEDELYRLPAQEGKSKAKARKSLWYVSEGLLLDYVGRDAPRQLWLSGPFTVLAEEGPYSPKILIDGTAYYQFSNDPAYFDDLKDYGIQIESSIGSPKTE